MDLSTRTRKLLLADTVEGVLRLYSAVLIVSAIAITTAAHFFLGWAEIDAHPLVFFAACAILAGLATAPIGRMLAGRITRPLARLVQASRDIQDNKPGLVVDLKHFSNSPAELRVVGLAFNKMADTIRMQVETAERQSLTDSLTGLYNRRFLVAEGPRLLHGALRNKSPFSCLMIDIDHFKAVNDTYGHLMGDKLLMHVARILATGIRGSDLLARAGGEEFVVLMPGTRIEEAVKLADRLRLALASNPLIEGGHALSRTVSIGVAEYSFEPLLGANIFEDMLEKADQAMYAAKQAGRDQVLAWRPPDGP